MTPVNVARTFFTSVNKLSTTDRGRVMDFFAKFMEDPSSPGLNFESIRGARESAVKSARITQDLRTILFQKNGQATLLYAGHHEDAYRWAEGRRVEHHPITGALQIVESTESVQAALPDPVTIHAPRLFAAYDDEYLVSLGLPPDWLTVLRQITNEDQLLGVATRLPEEVAERLLTLASGELVTPPVPVSPDLPLDQSEDNQRRFVVIKDSTELQSILDRPIEDWIRFLHPSQRSLITKDYRGPSRVSGAAGTGKTVVGMHRARALAAKGLKVLMTSFVGTLCRNIERNMDVLCACTQQEFDSTVRGRITVNTIHKIALTLVKKVDSRVKPVDDEQLEKILSRRNSQSGFLFETGFPLVEWNGVIDPQGIQSWEQYRSAPRTGRGKPLTVKQRRDAWSIFQGAIDDLRQQALYTWSQICIKAVELLESGQLESPFDAVIVDEVQDLQPQELRLLAALTNKAPENLMLLGDAGQRIYPGGFSLSRLGIDVRGRSTILRINYRTTDQIRRFADQLIPKQTDNFDGTVEDRKSRSLLTGPVPQLRGCRTEHEQQQFVVQRIRDAIAKGLQPREIAVFARSHNQLKGVAKAVADAAIAVHNVGSGSEEGDSSGVNFATMHRAKGLEFKFVFVIGCSNDIVPHRYTLTQLTDQADIDAGLERERQLLYVAITRARDEAFITWVGEPSEFLLPHIQSQNGTTT